MQFVRSCLVVLILAPSLAIAESSDLPNVIVIFTDDQGYGDASCLNQDSKFQTPNLDRLAREGMTFTDAHCSDTVCTPSRYGLLTGRYSWRTTLKRGVYGAEKACLIADGRMTLASLLRDAGYRTAMVGKWHLGMDFPGDRSTRDWSQPVQDMPLDKGFDYFWGIPASMNYGVLAWFEGRYAKVPPTQYTQKKPNQIAISDYRIMPPYESTPKDLGTTNQLGVVRGKLEVAPDFVDSECLTRFTDKAIEWMDEQVSEAESGEPFFVYLPYTSPHKPVIPLEPFRGKSGAGAYGDFMIETDWHVGRILKFLDEHDLTDNTLIWFSSDNGPETTWRERAKRFKHQSNAIYREGKRSIYEGGHRVPMFVRWPSRVKAGSICDKPVCHTDVLATLADIVDKPIPPNAGEDSVSFYPHLLGNQADARPPIIHHAANGRFAIRDGKWKLVMKGKQRQTQRELYDLETDPSETKNVLSQHQDIARDLVQKITQVVERGRTTKGPQQPNDTPWWDDLVWMKP
ncbi:MAG: arylsulfatase [Planctomycetota bacterium]